MVKKKAFYAMTGNPGGMTSTLETEAITAVCIVGTALMWRWMETGCRFGLKWMMTGILWEFRRSGWTA